MQSHFSIKDRHADHNGGHYIYRGYTVGYIASRVNITLEPTIFLHSGSQWACSTATASSVLRGNHLFSLEISNHVARRMRSAGPVQSNSKT